MFRLILGLFCVLLTSAVGLAQEDEEDALREISAELAAAERTLRTAREHVEFVEERIERLKKLRSTRKAIGEAELALKKAEDDGDEQLVETLEERLHELEVNVDRLWTMVELNDELWRIREIRSELNRTDRLFEGAERLFRLQRDRIELTEKRFHVYANGPEEEERPLEERAERLTLLFELRLAHLELSREVRRAREEGEEEAIEELESELRGVIEELREFDEDSVEPEPSEASVRTTAIPVGEHVGPVVLTAGQIVAAGKLNFGDDVVPLLKSACFECHNRESAAGDLDLQSLISRQPLVVNRSRWVNVIAQLQNRSMPPADEAQPQEAGRRQLVAYLSHAIHNFDYTTVRQPGFEPARRLTDEEYNNTVRDLFGVDLRPADSFPGDLTASSGFDNSANSLFIQPVTMERYVGAAEEIVRRALPEKRTTPEHDHVYQRIFGDGDGDIEEPVAVIGRFAARAYRRAVTPQDIQALTGYYRQQRASGLSYAAAVREVIQVVLASPSFLIRTEADRNTDEPHFVDNYELASRLSYFLWASMPDDELIHVARRGSDVFRDRDVLQAQIDRMLADERAKTLGSSFASQWLGFNDLGRVRPGPIDNPWCTDTLIASMKDESALFFWSLVRDNAPIEQLLTADYTYLNAELAKHYELKSIAGDELRPVSLAGTPRGGILGQGSILAVTSFPGRTSPVLRGQWILAELLGTPPPPPPPNVSEFNAELVENRKLSAKQKLELHRRNPNCYACHSQIDPLGFSLAEFDWFGRHRPQSRGRKADTRAQLPDGTEFEGLDGLRKVLIERRLNDLVTQITRKMLSYALGRQLEYYDEATVQEIVAAVQADGRKLQTLIREIVHSDTFQMKQRPKNL